MSLQKSRRGSGQRRRRRPGNLEKRGRFQQDKEEGGGVLGDPAGSARATVALPAAPGCVLPRPVRLCSRNLDSRFQPFFFFLTILTIVKCETRCVFSISTMSYNHHRYLIPERFRRPPKAAPGPLELLPVPTRAPGLCGSACPGRFPRTHVSAAWSVVSGFFPVASSFPGSFPSRLHSFLEPSSVLSREHAAFVCLFPW